MPTVATVPVWDRINDSAGNPIPDVDVYVTLNFNQATSTSPVTNVEAVQQKVTTNPTGTWTVNVVPVNKLSPSGCLYNVRTPYQSYDINPTDVNVPVGPPAGWQSSQILVVVPPGLGPSLPNFNVAGLLTAGSETIDPGPLIVKGAVVGQSFTAVGSGPYSSSSIPSSFNNEYRLPPPNGTDDTANILAAETAVSTYGSGKIIFQQGIYLASTLTKQSFTYWDGFGVDSTQIKLKNGVNADLIIGANFATLTGTGSQAGIHHWGISNMTLSGNKANNTAGYGVRVYGWCPFMQNVKIDDTYQDGIYSEYAAGVALPATNEEDIWGRLDNVQVYRMGGYGIHWLGPHDSTWVEVWCGKGATHGFFVDHNAFSDGGGLKAIDCHSFANIGNAWRINTQSSLHNCKGESTSAYAPATTAMVYIDAGANESEIIGGQYGTFTSGLHNGLGIELAPGAALVDLKIDTVIQNVTVAAMKIGAGAEGGGNHILLRAYLPDSGAVMFGVTQPAATDVVLATPTGPYGAALYQIPDALAVTTGKALKLYKTDQSAYASLSFDGSRVVDTWGLDVALTSLLRGSVTAFKDVQRSVQAVTLAGGTVTIDPTAGELCQCALSASTTLGAPTSPLNGQVLTLRFRHDNTGGAYVITWNAIFKRAGGAFANTNSANAIDTITFEYDNSIPAWQEIGRAINLS
jgi:hypothetical protein